MQGYMPIAVRTRLSNHPVPVTGSTHDALYECCAALIIAVMVVLYFDERVRRDLSARLRGYTIGSLGGLIGTGLLVPLFALAGFIKDTTAVRWFAVLYTLAFLGAAFSVAARSWGREDAARLRRARPSPLPQMPLPPPRTGMTEREHAAEVLGAALFLTVQFQPEVVLNQLSQTGPEPAWERLRSLAGQWYNLQPSLTAISAGYPSASVREHVGTFIQAASQAMGQPAQLFSDKAAWADIQARARWRDQATPAWEAAAHAWDEVVSSLHARRPSAAKPPGTAAARNGRTAPQP
jgi:hypothetical protein